MNYFRTTATGLLCLCFLSSTPVVAAEGNFSVLTYNIAGLPELLSSAESDRQKATEQISCYVKAFDIVNVQEDFNYHAALYDTCDDHPYRSETTGGAGIGSGLNTLSRYAYEDFDRVSWNDCNGVDCLTPKGFTRVRVSLQPGILVDVYNLHTQAQTESADLVARRANLEQLKAYIDLHSVGQAVIIMGDTNTRYTRSGDNIRIFLNDGFTDAWLTQERGNQPPAAGDEALVCKPPRTSADCEIVDKIMYRSNNYLQLTMDKYTVQQDAINALGQDLSDHPPVSVQWQYTTNPDWAFSPEFGGPHGMEFSDFPALTPDSQLQQITIRTGSRVDQISTRYDDGQTFSHGGTGGTGQSLTLQDGEYLTGVNLCRDEYDGHTRIFSVSLMTNYNNTLSGGTTTGDCTFYQAQSGWQIIGFQGRSGDEIDKLGVIYSRVHQD